MTSGRRRWVGGSIAAWALAAISLYACGGTSDAGEGAGGSGGSSVATDCKTFKVGAPCSGDFYCTTRGSCSASGCCDSAYECRDGIGKLLGHSDACMQFNPSGGGWAAGGSGGQSGSAGGGGLSGSVGGAGGQSAGGTSAGEGGTDDGGAGEPSAGEGGANDGGAGG
jgi:hypothetical protein